MGKEKRIIALAAVLGVATAVVGYQALSSMAAGASVDSDAYADVVVTAADLTFGARLEPTMLRVVRYPREAVPAGAFADIDSVVGQTTKVFMGASEPVTTLKLSSRAGGLSMMVRPSLRAVSVEVGQVSGVSGFVLPADRVDVLVTVDRVGSFNDAVTRTLLQNIEVLAAGQKTQQENGDPLTVQSVTLLVNPEGAEMVTHGQHEGQIHLVLRNPDDQDEVKTPSYSTREMLSSAQPRPRPRTVRRAPAVASVKPSTPERVRIIRSATVTEVQAPVDGKKSQ